MWDPEFYLLSHGFETTATQNSFNNQLCLPSPSSCWEVSGGRKPMKTFTVPNYWCTSVKGAWATQSGLLHKCNLILGTKGKGMLVMYMYIKDVYVPQNIYRNLLLGSTWYLLKTFLIKISLFFNGEFTSWYLIFF